MGHHAIEVKLIAGAMGAEMSGIDLSKPLANTASDDIQQALYAHKAIFLRDQKLTPEDHLRVADIFGEFYRVPFVKARDNHPDIIEIVKEESDSGKYNLVAFGIPTLVLTNVRPWAQLFIHCNHRHTAEIHFGQTWKPRMNPCRMV